ncbi:MAG: nucleoside hydrolase [Ardenticatenaceae bacterium]|nr:nucleoside hydrolase [Anaerolineales bacterium]MCB8938371.1 nucleoside hydrolase [Ardenticatenaceae bacterium]MCB8975319.1 nucleoside hydrolase [Ardenticatenaceae bacterium]
MEKLIIDTDPGVDDAQAILMAAAHPNATIAAILAVGGNVGLEHTLRNALTLVEVVEQEIPVYAGCSKPLVIFQEDAADVHGQDGLGDVGLAPQTRTAESEHAALALVRMANESPGEYTLVAIGPLTNIAVALTLDPTLPEKLKRFVVMGGAVTAHGNTSNVSAEFNIFYDPEAAHVVFEAWEAHGGLIELVDWEATIRHGIPGDVIERWHALDTPKSRFYQKMSAKTLEFIRNIMGRSMMFGADPLAMAVALEPDIVTKAEVRHVSVELTGMYTRGQTTTDWNQRNGRTANTNIILELDTDRFFSLMEQGLK